MSQKIDYVELLVTILRSRDVEAKTAVKYILKVASNHPIKKRVKRSNRH